jgi:hypothetical protein
LNDNRRDPVLDIEAERHAEDWRARASYCHWPKKRYVGCTSELSKPGARTGTFGTLPYRGLQPGNRLELAASERLEGLASPPL